MSEANVREEMIRVEGLSHREGDRAFFSSLSFTVKAGGVHGILGPHGAGKSLFFSFLAGTTQADEGEIMICGKELLTDGAPKNVKIGYLPQHPAFYKSMTVFEILDFVSETRGVSANRRYRQIKEALDLVGLSSVQNRLFERLTPSEAKRTALAAALLGNPDVILLDEPFLWVESDLRGQIAHVISMLGGVKTVLLASSDFSVIREFCDDVLILSDGEVLAQGSFEELEQKLAAREEGTTLEEIYRSLFSADSRSADASNGKEVL